MKGMTWLAVGTGLIAALVTTPVMAGLNVSSKVKVVAKPSSQQAGQFESDDFIHVWKESAGKLSKSVRIDHDGTAGVFTAFNDLSGIPGNQTLAKGQVYESYMVHVDPMGTSSPEITFVNEAITFDRAIIGIMVRHGGTGGTTLAASDFLTDIATEGFAPNRGFEMIPADDDAFSISTDGRTITFNSLSVSMAGIDEIRILTATPELASIALWSVLGVGGLYVRRRMKKTAA